MTRYLLSLYQPDTEPPVTTDLNVIMRDLDALEADMKRAGAWVFSGGLHAPSTATVVRHTDNEVLITDGPYIEGKEHIGGFVIVKTADLDAALDWGSKLSRAATLPVEVRPFQGEAEA
jgi:hypothetical protein